MKKIDIADYDLTNYDYSTYWSGREYEDKADKIALEKLLMKSEDQINKHDIYIDIGGSYGREFEIYSKYFSNIILFDYSLNTLINSRKYFDSKGEKNIIYVAGNVYFMPFKDASINGGQMIRVMHHLKETQLAFNEINRVINKFFILEFANKINFKHILQYLFKLNAGYIHTKDVMQQKAKKSAQGSEGEDQIFLNFHPKYIEEALKTTDFFINEKLSVSNFRHNIFKKSIPHKALVHAEKYSQKVLAGMNFGPSIYFLLNKRLINTAQIADFHLDDILCCPKCKNKLDILRCETCKIKFKIQDGVYDLRYS